MFTPATQQQQKQPAAASTPEEEALKRNTDCVYFLASPLTCKKGSECEYRHSEYARINPRDCYYWLNGNCLNPKCGFRHPPLDGLLGNQNQGGAPTGSVQAPLSTGKQAVPCVFFQKGMCIKGDRCAFFHVQKLVETATPPVEPESFKKPFEKVTEKKKSPLAKVVKADTDKGSAPKVANVGLRDSRSVERYVPNHVGYEGPKKVVGVPLFTDGGHSDNTNNSFHFGKNRDDVVRESSPGFDVLVDNELRDSEYYRGEDQYGRRGQDGKNSVSEFDPDFDNTSANGDAEAFHDHHGFDHYNHIQDRQYDWGHRRTSSERGDHLERRGYLTDERSSDHILESDLRHRLSKHRRIHGRDHLERGFVDSRRDSMQENSIGRRLQGRIKLPGRINGGDTHSESGSWERNTQGRLRDRIKGKLEENHYIDHERGTRTPWMRRREMEDDRNYEFPAPKRLAVLKRGKEEPLLRKKRSLDDHLHRDSEDSFAAPLPLSEILKRKRAAGIVSGGSSDEKDSKIQQIKQEDKAEVGHDQSSEPKERLEGETDEGTMVDEGMIEDQGYEGDDQNGEYYYEQGYEEDGEYNYEEGENVEEEYVEEGVETEEDGGDEFAKKMGVMF